eukprot:2776959-Prymnesium_polylepis.1
MGVRRPRNLRRLFAARHQRKHELARHGWHRGPPPEERRHRCQVVQQHAHTVEPERTPAAGALRAGGAVARLGILPRQ